MPHIESSIEIAAPPEKVWELISDPDRYPEWVVPTDEMLEVPQGELGAGSVYKERGGIAPFKGTSEWRVNAFEPHHRQVHDGDDGTMKIHLEIEITPAGGGSRMRQSIDAEPRWFIAPLVLVLWPLMLRSKAQRAMDDTLANAKAIVEASASSE